MHCRIPTEGITTLYKSHTMREMRARAGNYAEVSCRSFFFFFFFYNISCKAQSNAMDTQIAKVANRVCTRSSDYLVLSCWSLCPSSGSNWTCRLSRWSSLQILFLNFWRPEMRWHPKVWLWDSRPSEFLPGADHSPTTVWLRLRGRLRFGGLSFSIMTTGYTATARDVKRGNRVCNVGIFGWSRKNCCRWTWRLVGINRRSGRKTRILRALTWWEITSTRWNISFWYRRCSPPPSAPPPISRPLLACHCATLYIGRWGPEEGYRESGFCLPGRPLGCRHWETKFLQPQTHWKRQSSRS